MKTFITVLCLLHAALAAPQFLTFKDGQVGVNFFGYHAEAGLGGGQNGNGLLGGLHASAGTPHGQNAAAGLGGNVNGRAAGVLYAGAQATPDVGASSILGGDTSSGGFGASESYVPGKRTSHTRTTIFEKTPHNVVVDETQYVTEGVTGVQKIRPPKKFYNYDSSHVHSSYDGGSDFVVLPGDNDQTYGKNLEPNLASIAITKTINKTTISTPTKTTPKRGRILNSATSLSSSSSSSSLSSLSSSSSSSSYPATHNPTLLTADSSAHNHGIDVAVAPYADDDSVIVAPPITAASSVPLTHSSEDNSNGNQNDKSTVTSQSSTTKTKLRTRQQIQHRAHPHRIRHQQRKLQRRLNGNDQRVRSKTIVRTVDQQQHQLEPQTPQHQHDQNLLFVGQQQTHPQNPPQQEASKHQERRQFIASTDVYEDQQPQYVIKPVQRQSHVVNALQIPVGILQSLQETLGR